MSTYRPQQSSPDKDLQRRLEAYSRYVALVHAQEEAVEEGDLERFAELGEARQEIQDELGDSLSHPDRDSVPEDPEGRALLETAMASLRSAMAGDERMRSTLANLRKETVGSIRTMETRKGQVDSYLGWQEPPGGHMASKVNRKG